MKKINEHSFYIDINGEICHNPTEEQLDSCQYGINICPNYTHAVDVLIFRMDGDYHDGERSPELSGWLKHNGCADWHIGPSNCWHLCGLETFDLYRKIMKQCYIEAAMILGDKWDYNIPT